MFSMHEVLGSIPSTTEINKNENASLLSNILAAVKGQDALPCHKIWRTLVVFSCWLAKEEPSLYYSSRRVVLIMHLQSLHWAHVILPN
jgi:hypothetical protein